MKKPAALLRFEDNVLKLTKQLSGLLRLRYGLSILGVISFIESALFVPIVTDPFLVAYILIHKARTLAAIIVTTLTSVFGGFVAYITAAFFIDLILNFVSPETVTQFYELTTRLAEGSLLLAFLGAVTPIPFTLVAVVAGAMKGNLLLFLLGASIGRALRYGIVGYLAYRFGEVALALARRHIGVVTLLAFFICSLYLWVTM